MFGTDILTRREVNVGFKAVIGGFGAKDDSAVGGNIALSLSLAFDFKRPRGSTIPGNNHSEDTPCHSYTLKCHESESTTLNAAVTKWVVLMSELGRKASRVMASSMSGWPGVLGLA